MRAQLIFREPWTESPPARPLTQEHVAHADLVLGVHGPGCAQLKKSHHHEIPGDPWYVWSGKCTGRWALSLRHRRWLIAAGDDARVRLCTRQSGPMRLRLLLKPEGAPWLVSEESIGATDDWHESELPLVRLRWHALDIESIVAGARCASPDLARIDAVGFTDFSAGGDSAACSRVSWIELWGTPLARATHRPSSREHESERCKP